MHPYISLVLFSLLSSAVLVHPGVHVVKELLLLLPLKQLENNVVLPSGNELEVTISFHFKHVLIVFENKNVNGSVPKIYLDDDILLGEGDVGDSLRLCYQRRSLHVFQRRDAERVQPLFLLLVGYFTESNKPAFHSLC